jgi:hypothetical protein
MAQFVTVETRFHGSRVVPLDGVVQTLETTEPSRPVPVLYR